MEKETIETLIKKLKIRGENADYITTNTCKALIGYFAYHKTINTDDVYEIASCLVDIYENEIAGWLLTYGAVAASYVNEAVREFGIDGQKFDIYIILRWGQFLHYETKIYQTLNELGVEIE